MRRDSRCAFGIGGFQERTVRLYEQDGPPEEIRRPVGQYVRPWKQWAAGGIQDVSAMFRVTWRIPSATRLRFTSAIATKPVASSAK